MTFLAPSRVARQMLAAPALIALALTQAVGCQKKDDRPPFLACDSDCSPLPGISIGTGSPGGGSSVNPTGDAGPGTLSGQVFVLSDQSFALGALYTTGATVTADGASGTPVSTNWDGIDDYSLAGVAKLATNWVSVKPTLTGDPLFTYQAVDTSDLETVNLSMVSGGVLDAVLNSVSLLRSQSGAGQVVLFFQSKGTHVPLAGLHVAMPQAEQAVYRSGTTWVVDDGTATTDQNGLIVFVNVAPGNSAGTQTVTVTKAASGTTPAANAGSFAVKVVDSAVTIATVEVQL